MNEKYSCVKGNKIPIRDLSTIVFMDYDSLYWGLFNQYGGIPNLEDLIEDIKQRGKLENTKVFIDPSKSEFEEEVQKIRTITNEIIDCCNYNNESKKDYLDFIMLDHIYRTIYNNPGIEQYILITGDGHFSSVVTFLKNIQNKSVGIYGVKGSLSNQLVKCSSWAMEITKEKQLESELLPKLIDTLKWFDDNNMEVPFSYATKKAASYHYENESQLRALLSQLIRDGYVKQEEKNSNEGYPIKIIKAQWELIQDLQQSQFTNPPES